jgi:hypothetical protein
MTKQTLYVPVTIYDDHNTGIIVKHIHSGHKYPVNKKTVNISKYGLLWRWDHIF